MTDGEKTGAKGKRGGFPQKSFRAFRAGREVFEMTEKGTRALYASDLQKLRPVSDMGPDCFFGAGNPEGNGKSHISAAVNLQPHATIYTEENYDF